MQLQWCGSEEGGCCGSVVLPLSVLQGSSCPRQVPITRIRTCAADTHTYMCLLLTYREMRVQWTTRDPGNPVVKWGSTSGHYTHTTPASSSSGYTVKEMCGPPANSVGWVDPGTFHSTVLRGLEPGRRYFYVVGDEVSWLTDLWIYLWSETRL